MCWRSSSSAFFGAPSFRANPAETRLGKSSKADDHSGEAEYGSAELPLSWRKGTEIDPVGWRRTPPQMGARITLASPCAHVMGIHRGDGCAFGSGRKGSPLQLEVFGNGSEGCSPAPTLWVRAHTHTPSSNAHASHRSRAHHIGMLFISQRYPWRTCIM